MKEHSSLRREKPPIITKCALTALFLIGALLLVSGLRGQRIIADDGFSSESAYRVIYSLSGHVGAVYRSHLKPDIDALEESDRAGVLSVARTLAVSAFETQSAGAGKDAEEAIRLSAGREDETALRLLYAAYLVSGPKINSSARKAIVAADSPEFRRQLLRCIADDTLPLPAESEGAVGDLQGEAKKAMLMQVYFTATGSAGGQGAENANEFKKTVRDKGQQLLAFRMAARGEVSFLRQLITGHSKTVTLLGIILLLDAVLLTLLMFSEKTWRFDVKWIFILLIVDFLLYFQMLPIVYMVIRSFFPEGSFTLDVFRRLYTEPINLEALKNTLITSFATMILGTLIAFPLAFLVGRTNLYGRKFFRSLFVITYMVPPYVGAMAWLRLMNPNVGTVNLWIRAIFGLSDAPGPLNVYSLPGMIWVLTTFYYPYAFITISRAMEKMDPSLEEASRVSGASPLKTLFTVTLPMMMPSLIGGALLVFISAASCYGIPSIVGIPGNVNTVTTRIVEYNGQSQVKMNDATALAVFLMAVALIVLFISDVVLARKQYITVSGKSVRPSIVDLRRWRVPLTVMICLFAVVMVVIPFTTILLTSLKGDIGKSVLDSGNFTLNNWTGIFTRNETISCLKNSLLFASCTATVGLVIACVMSYLMQRTRVRGRTIPNFLITLGSGTPSVVIALGLIITMRGNFGLDIYNTAWIMIIAYLIKYQMMGMRTVVSAMSQIHVSLEECSQVSGAGWLTTMRRVTGPLILPSIAAGWFLIFIPSFYELSMTALLYTGSTKTIGYQLFEYWTNHGEAMSCAMAFGILLIVVVLNFILGRLTKGEFSI